MLEGLLLMLECLRPWGRVRTHAQSRALTGWSCIIDVRQSNAMCRLCPIAAQEDYEKQQAELEAEKKRQYDEEARGRHVRPHQIISGEVQVGQR